MLRMYGVLLCLSFLGAFTLSFGQQQNIAPVFDTLNTTGIDGDLKKTLVTDGVLENVAAGTFLGQLSARVPSVPNAVITYSVLSQTVDVTSSGRVTLKVALDRERASSSGNNLQATFIATYLTVSSDVTIIISVIDVNDNPPVFQNLPYNFEVNENTVPGSDVYNNINVTDRDIGNYAEIELECFLEPNDTEGEEACKKFGVRAVQQGQGVYRGIIFLKNDQTVDFEEKRGYIMNVKARDNPFITDSLHNTASVNVLIDVGDIQDTPPRFLNTPITLFVYENAPVGTRLGLITAQDGDEKRPRQIYIRSLDTANLFAISNATLELGSDLRYRSNITVQGLIDREAQQARYEFTAEAIELDNGVLTDQRATTQVIINILDEDDNVPTFDQSFYNVSVLELDTVNVTGSTAPVPGLNIRVTDPDDATNARFNIAIVSQPNPGVFSITPTNGTQQAQVTVIVNRPDQMNYENPANRIQDVVVRATDATNVTRFSTTTVRISLEDINDNAPRFAVTSQTATISENSPVGTSIITITATDLDSGDNGRITYSLSGTGKDRFNVNPDTGYVSLKEPLDFETNPIYALLFVAEDRGSSPRQTVIPLTINVTDYNDSPPVFLPSSYSTTVNENSTVLLIPVQVQATDVESGTNIRYRILSGNTADNAFELNQQTGNLLLRRGLNYEETPGRGGVFTLVVEAQDAGIPPLTANATISISVNDLNNHEPVFNPSFYSGIISELAPVGTIVTQLTATDNDFGSNGELSYYIWTGGSDDFTVDTTGRVQVSNTASLDVDTIGIYNITVHARDQGSPPKTGTATVRVTLTDANNKNPSFLNQVYLQNVQEDVAVGTSVLRVSATDPDSYSVLEYSILRSSISARNSNGEQVSQFFPFDYREAFEIEPATGWIKVKTQLDRDSAAEIEMTTVVTDVNATNMLQTATAQIIITILGTADPTPYFAAPWTPTNPNYFYTLPEEMPINSTISTLIATDPTIPKQIQNFEIISDVGNFFSINRTSGQLRIRNILDYENLNLKRVYLSVRALTEDGTRSAVANITVQVQDINDNKPEFFYDSYNFTISEDRRYPSQVATVFATDKDSGSYAAVEYKIAGQNSQDFTVLPQTNGNQVTHVFLGTPLVQKYGMKPSMLVWDKIIPPYEIDTGIIIVSNGTILDYERIPEYKLTLQATDNPNANISQIRNTVTRPLTIRVLDINDNKPNFTSPEYFFYTVESFDVGRNIGQVKAVDNDGGQNGEIIYSFSNISTDAAILFGIDPIEGYIYSRNNLEGASFRSPYRFQVQARDQGQPVQITHVMVNINVSSGQLDNGQPVWRAPTIGFVVNTVRENDPVNTFVYQAIAFPRTVGANAIYSFLSNPNNPSGSEAFNIDPVSGNITVKGNLDREAQEIYDLILLATDSLNSTLQSTRLLTIRLQDVDDQLPSFKNCPNKQYNVPEVVNIEEGLPAGSFVFRAEACDLDSSLYNKVQYDFYHPPGHDYCSDVSSFFSLNSSTGEVITTVPLDREQNSSFLVCIEASQAVGRRKRYTLEEYRTLLASEDSNKVLYLLVQVTDVNDQGPTFPDVGELYTYVFDLPDKDTVITLTANDPDSDINNRIRFFIDSIQHRTYDGSREISVYNAFLINSDSGQLSVGFPSYKAFTNGYFIVTVRAEDYANPAFRDTETVKIYVAKELDQVRVTMSTKDDTAFVDNLIRELESLSSNTKFVKTQIRYHKTATGTVSTQTDVCMLVIQQDRVRDAYAGTNLLESSRIIEALSREGLYSPAPCEPSTTRDLEGWSVFWWVLVALAIFMFVIVLILMYAIWALYRNYRGNMESRVELIPVE